MQRTLFSAVFLLVSIFGDFARADGPATQPATRPTDTTTPMAFLITYDALAGEGPDAYRAMYSIDASDDTQRLAQVQAKFDAQAGMLQKMVGQLWGEDAVDQTLHALGLKSMRDVQTATVKEEGNRAKVTFGDGTPGPDLIKTPAGWRLNLQALRESLGVPVDDYLKEIRVLSKAIPDVADGIAGGKLKSISAVVSDIAKRLNPN